MQNNNHDNLESDIDRATSSRLGQLRAMPVDTRSFDEKLQSQIPFPRPRRQVIRFFRPSRIVAACLIVLGLVAAFKLIGSGNQVLASQMVQMHYDLVSGKTPVTKVESIEAANKFLSGQSPKCPELPKVPDRYEMACCMKSVKGKKMACVLLKGEGAPVTMTVANAADMQTPKSPTVVRGGVTYHVQSSGALNMVLSQRNGQWVCLIGEMSAEKLMDLEMKLHF